MMTTRPIKRTRAVKLSWAIETALGTPKYWKMDPGARVATYSTRRSARTWLAELKRGYRLPQAARVVRVAVTVTTIGRG